MASNCGHEQEYHLLLTNLSQRLSKEDLKSLIFPCGDILPRPGLLPMVSEPVLISFVS